MPFLFWPGDSLRLGRQMPSELEAAALQKDAQYCCSSDTSWGIPTVCCVCVQVLGIPPTPPRDLEKPPDCKSCWAGSPHLQGHSFSPYSFHRLQTRPGCPEPGMWPPSLAPAWVGTLRSSYAAPRGEHSPRVGCRKGSRATLESTPDSFLPCVHAGPDHPPLTITVHVLPASSLSCRQRGCCFRWGQALCPVCRL